MFRRRALGASSSDVSSSSVTFGLSQSGRSRTVGATELSALSTETRKVEHATRHVHATLGDQMSVVRRVFRELDPARNGEAALPILRTALIDALRLHDRWHRGLDHLLGLADPARTGRVVYGRLTRLIRTSAPPPPPLPSTPAEGKNNLTPSSSVNNEDNLPALARRATTAAVSASPRGGFGLVDDGDAQLRVTFAGVNTGDKQLWRRLGEGRAIPAMSTNTIGAANILGDSALRVPWAVAGDDARMNHILSSIHKERLGDLITVLRSCASPATPDRLTHAQLREALRTFDPFVHDAEVLQYFVTLANQTRGITAEQLQAADGSSRYTTAAEEALVPPHLKRDAISIPAFVSRFGHNVLAAPAMRCSATFELGWSNFRPPLPTTTVVGTGSGSLRCNAGRTGGRGAGGGIGPKHRHANRIGANTLGPMMHHTSSSVANGSKTARGVGGGTGRGGGGRAAGTSSSLSPRRSSPRHQPPSQQPPRSARVAPTATVSATFAGKQPHPPALTPAPPTQKRPPPAGVAV